MRARVVTRRSHLKTFWLGVMPRVITSGLEVQSLEVGEPVALSSAGL